ncbi:MAG: MOP flippase family protein [Myxococcota bacterium]
MAIGAPIRDGGAAPPQEAGAERVLASVRWVAAGQLLTQGARLVVSVVLARLLSPNDFGLMTMAAVFTAIGHLVATMGIGATIVQRREVSEALLRSLASVGIGSGVALWIVFAVTAEEIARFFAEPAVAGLVTVLAANFALSSFGMVPEALLQRELRFGRVVAVDLAALVVASGGALALAASGYGVWSLVVPNVVSTALRGLLLVWISPWPLRLGFDARAVSGVLGFGGSILAFNGLIYLTRHADSLIIGRALGAAQLGLYDYAYRFYAYPVEVITGVLLGVMFPTFARLQDRREALGRAFLRANGAIALVTFPMMAGLGAVAGPFVRVVLGEQWVDVIPLVQILAPLGAMQSLGATPGQIFLATGNAALRLGWAVVYTIVIVASFVVGAAWGIVGVATAYAIVMVPITAIGFWIAMRLIDAPLVSVWRTLRSTTAAAAGMALLVLGLDAALAARGAGDPVRLFVDVPSGVVAYCGAIWLLRPAALADVLRLVHLDHRIANDERKPS